MRGPPIRIGARDAATLTASTGFRRAGRLAALVGRLRRHGWGRHHHPSHGRGLAWAALLPLGAALIGALRDILTRRSSVSDSSSSILLFTTTAVMLASLASCLADPVLGWSAVAWHAMPLERIGMLAGTGILLADAQYLMIEAVRRSEVGLVAPFKYTSMVWAVLTGFLIYDTLPDQWIVAGSTLVIASGLYILQRERMLKTDRKSVPDRPDSAPLSQR